MGILNNQWVVTIVGGIIVALLTRTMSNTREPSVNAVDTLLGLLVFLLMQPLIMVMEKEILRSFAADIGHGVYWFIMEICAIITTVLTIQKRRQNRESRD